MAILNPPEQIATLPVGGLAMTYGTSDGFVGMLRAMTQPVP
jgi:hypothetical protein